MGCAPLNSNFQRTKILSEFRSEKTYPVELEKIKSIRISEGVFINEQNCNPDKFYETIQTLGEGSFGVVYKVVKKHTKPPIYRAMKKISKIQQDLDNDSELSLINEINILKSLDHPNIMKIYEYFNTDKDIYIISELCEGGELFDKITQEKYFTENSSKVIMKQLFSAIGFCHSNGVIHRDLKPENILLTKKEFNSIYDFQIKVIDFGTSAKFIKGNNFHKIIGTPFYVAPEVLINNYNEKCDLWSLGVIMYILLFGVPPFYGNNDEEICDKVVKGEFSFEIKGSKIKISNEAKDLISKLLTKDTEQRLTSSQALEHPWIKNIEFCFKTKDNSDYHEDSNIILQVTNNLKNFYATQKLQQLTLAYIVHNLVNIDEIKKLRSIFLKFDSNGDGHLTKDELMHGLMEMMEKEEAKKEVNRLMEIIDTDGNGFIEYEEFLRASMDKDKLLSKKNLQIVFDFLDKNKNGKISYDEIKDILDKENKSEDDIWKALVNEVDLDGDGEISFNEFVYMMKNVKEKT